MEFMLLLFLSLHIYTYRPIYFLEIVLWIFPFLIWTQRLILFILYFLRSDYNNFYRTNIHSNHLCFNMTACVFYHYIYTSIKLNKHCKYGRIYDQNKRFNPLTDKLFIFLMFIKSIASFFDADCTWTYNCT